MNLLRNAFCTIAIGIAAPVHAATPPQCTAASGAIDAAVAKTMKQGSPGMLVEAAHSGGSLFARAYGYADLEHGVPLARDDVFRLASVTKQFTAAAILQLVEDGKLSLDDSVSKHLPEFPAGAGISIYQLLVQTSGIPDYAEDPAGEATRSAARSPEEMLRWIIKLTPKLQFEPGSKWAYSNSNYVLLGIIAERISDRSLQQLFEERLFKPAGMTATAMDDPTVLVPRRVQGYRRSKTAQSGFANAAWFSPSIPWAAGGLRTTTGDLIRWTQALYAGRIIKPEMLARMTAPGRLRDGRTTKLGMPEDWQKGLNSDYGMGVFITPTEHGKRIWHAGDIDGFSTWLGHFPDKGVTIAMMINSQSARMDVEGITDAIFTLRHNDCG